MKTKNLLPNRWKPLGWILLAICIPLGIWLLIDEDAFPLSLKVSIPWPFYKGDPENTHVFDFLNYHDGFIILQLIDEIIALIVLSGLMLVGFARLKNEDERIAQMRLEALQWALYGNTLILALCILFVHGLPFLTIMIYNMFTPLLIFVLRFHWLIWKEAQEMKRQEGGEIPV